MQITLYNRQPKRGPGRVACLCSLVPFPPDSDDDFSEEIINVPDGSEIVKLDVKPPDEPFQLRVTEGGVSQLLTADDVARAIIDRLPGFSPSEA